MKTQMLLYRTQRALRRYGVRGALRRAWERAWRHLLLSESHVWYELDPAGARPKPPLAQGLTLRRAREPDLPLLDQLDTISPVEARVRIDEGNDLWLVLEGGRPLFSCWIFRGRTPAIAAPGNQLPLRMDTVCLEDCVTAAAARGRGIAPAAWAAIANVLADEGQHHVITKVGVDNAPSRRAVEKAGFEPVALMQFRRRGPISRTSVKVLDAKRGGFFAGRLGAARTRRIGRPAERPPTG
jgi:GNAT superfamily N-acetyltransferase